MEEWKDIPGYEGRYQVSSLGRVKSLPRLIYTGAVPNFHLKGRILRPGLRKDGYYQVCLGNKSLKVHRLVALAFLPNQSGKLEVNHKDGNKKNNHLENLEWVSKQENSKHASIHFLFPHGEAHKDRKLSEDDVREIRQQFNAGTLNQSELGRKYGVNRSVISRLVRGLAWKSVA